MSKEREWLHRAALSPLPRLLCVVEKEPCRESGESFRKIFDPERGWRVFFAQAGSRFPNDETDIRFYAGGGSVDFESATIEDFNLVMEEGTIEIWEEEKIY